MQVRFFTVSVNGEGETELNAFLSSHRVLIVDRRFVELGANSFWSVAVEFIEGATPRSGTSGKNKTKRVDYMEVLPPEQFKVFARLRDVRKTLAAEEAVPPYVVFTDEQLAHMVTEGVDTKGKMRDIPGVGEAKVKKYGDPILSALTAGDA